MCITKRRNLTTECIVELHLRASSRRASGQTRRRKKERCNRSVAWQMPQCHFWADPFFSSTSVSSSFTLPRYMLTHEITNELMLWCQSTFSQVLLKGGKTHRLIVPNNKNNSGNQNTLLATSAIHKLLKILNHLYLTFQRAAHFLWSMEINPLVKMNNWRIWWS